MKIKESIQIKIALTCSHGGHLTELLYLLNAFEGHDIFFITYDNIRTQNLDYKKYLFPNFGENPYKMFFNLHKIIKILLNEKPDIIVSNGAEIAIPFFYLAKLLRIKTLFIECYTRIDTPTITGKFVYPVSNLFLVLWPEMQKKYGEKAEYWGGMFKIIESDEIKKTNCNNILVITGMHSGFDRLIKKIDEIAVNMNDKFIVQSGNANFVPKNTVNFDFKDYDDILSLIKSSKLVICPGSMSAIDSIFLGTPVIIVPRSDIEGEVINYHQKTFAKKLNLTGFAKTLEDLEGMKELIESFDHNYRKKMILNNELILKIKNSLVLKDVNTDVEKN